MEVSLRVPDQEAARDLQQAVSTFCRTELHALLQDVFDSVASDCTIRIDRLELNLPAFRNEDEFREQLKERIRQELRSRLGDAVAAAVSEISLAIETDAAARKPVAFDTAYGVVGIFVHIMRYGVAPWHAVGVTLDEVIHEIIELLENEPTVRRQLTEVLSGSEGVLRRFVQQVSPVKRHRIISLVTQTDESRIGEFVQVLDDLVQVLIRRRGLLPNPGRMVREIFFRNLLRLRSMEPAGLEMILDEVISSLIHEPGRNGSSIIADLPLAAMEMERMLPRHWQQMIRDRIAAFSVHASSRRQGVDAPYNTMPVGGQSSISPGRDETSGPLEAGSAKAAGGQRVSKAGDDVFPGQATEKNSALAAVAAQGQGRNRDHREEDRPVRWQDEGAAEEESVPRRLGRVVSLERGRPAQAGPDREMPQERQESAGVPWMTAYDREEYHIGNAGLILVAPFCSVAFKDLGYLNQRRDFVTGEAGERAVHFTQFLVTSVQHPAECDLVLNKIICGMEPDTPLERFIDLSAQELAAAREVLDSAIGHWEVLKRTSVPVFQQTFLQHDGILTRQSSNWLLRIERTSVDVLIDTVPWTISIIKHPWMKQPVMVEW